MSINDNVEEMDKFLESYKLPKITQEIDSQINHLSNKCNWHLKTFPQNTSGPDSLTGEFSQTFYCWYSHFLQTYPENGSGGNISQFIL